MVNRAANATIKGYFYQFDYAILRLLNQVEEDDPVVIEGLEDIDIITAAGDEYIQCKYYSGTDYNHSVIKSAIGHMLRHYKTIGMHAATAPRYIVYGHYKNGQEKLPAQAQIDVDFTKEHFFTTKKEGVDHYLHIEVGASDQEIAAFLACLTINVYAEDYEEQFESICTAFRTQILKCAREDVDDFYYPNSIDFLRSLAIATDLKERTTTKRAFIRAINKKSVTFNRWYFELRGREQYLRRVKATYFKATGSTKLEKVARFFVLDAKSEFDLAIVIRLSTIIGEKYSHQEKKRTPAEDRFCPYIFFKGISNEELIEIKQALAAIKFKFVDGFDFNGAAFSADSVRALPTKDNLIKLKIIGSTPDLNLTIASGHGCAVEIFDFYKDEPSVEFTCPPHVLRHNIKIDFLNSILEVI